MAANMDDAGNAPKKKSSEIRDLPTDEVADEEAGTVKGGMKSKLPLAKRAQNRLEDASRAL